MKDPAWHAPVGKFMLAFGEIEHWTTLLFGCLPGCNFEKAAAKLPLGTRLEILKEVLPRDDSPEHKSLLERIAEVEANAAMRNLVAHNGVGMDVKVEGKKIFFSYHLVSSRDNRKKLSLAQLITLAEEIDRISVRFVDAAVDVAKMHIEDPSDI